MNKLEIIDEESDKSSTSSISNDELDIENQANDQDESMIMDYESDMKGNTKDKEEEIKPDNKVFIEQKSLQQVLDESKLRTEQELIKLGQQMNEKENHQKELDSKLENHKKIISKYDGQESIQIVDDLIKSKKYIELKELLDVLFEHEKIVNEKINEKDKKIKKLDIQIDDALQDNKDVMEENIKLEEKEENYWNPRVKKLRDKLIEKNKMIKYFHICYIFTIAHTFILTKFGLYEYINFWINLFYILYKISIFIIFFLPNTYKIITNSNNYYFLFDFMNKKIFYCLTSIFGTINLLYDIIYHIIFKSSVTLGLIVFSLILIRIINKYFLK